MNPAPLVVHRVLRGHRATLVRKDLQDNLGVRGLGRGVNLTAQPLARRDPQP